MSIHIKGQPIERLEGVFNADVSEVMRRRGFTTLDQFADFAGIGRTTMYNLVIGRRTNAGELMKPSLDTLILLAEALNIPVHTLIYRLAPDAPGHDVVEHLPPVHGLDIAIAGWCGAGPEQLRGSTERVWVDNNLAAGRDLTAYRVRGDSMAATDQPIHDGDIVIVDRADRGANNEPVVALLRSGGYVCKLLKNDQHGHFLQSANPAHTNGTPTYIPLSDIEQVIGAVVRIIHDR